MTVGICMANASQKSTYMTASDVHRAGIIGKRAADWRMGSVVYHVFVDRFAPSRHLELKRFLYAAPRTLEQWNVDPKPGRPEPSTGVYTHELAFWGGDIDSLEGRLEYIQSLGADVVYLNPVQEAVTNHKYDALDWSHVAPEYGTREDVARLAQDLHGRKMRLILDGVFNHVGKASRMFQSAQQDPTGPFRDWFFFGKQFPAGYRAWANVANLPEVRLESKGVRDYLWAKPDSVIQKYLHDGVDGWRLDTAYELGPQYLYELTQAAHHAKADSVVVGEVWNYPAGWFPAMDGVMNFFARQTVLDMIDHKVSTRVAGKMLERMVEDAGIENLLKSWLILDNHDTSRIKSILPDERQRRLAQVLHFTLPGSPVVYYGSELGMEGQGDPGSRGPMRWELNTPQNTELRAIKKLLAIRKANPALRIGDYMALDSDHLLAFSRQTDKALDTMFILANPSNETVKESLSCREGRLMNGGQLRDELTGETVTSFSGIIDVTVPPLTARIYSMVNQKGYTPYKRMH